MPTDTSVKYIHSGMAGAPALTGQPGSLIALLDAVLVNGFGTAAVDSVVIAGGVATVTRSAGHPMGVGTVASIAGATVSGGSINGERKVLAIPVPTPTSYSFEAAGLADQVATGTITHKVAPLGWTKAFAGTNVAAYKPTDVAATGCLLRVDDTGTNDARAVGYESMSDVNTGVGPFPTSAQMSGGIFWPKSQTSNTTTRPWVIIGDGRLFFSAQSWLGGTNYGLPMCFGDVPPFKTPDAYCCLLAGPSSSQASFTPGSSSCDLAHSNSTASGMLLMVPRGYSGLGGAVSVVPRAMTLWSVVGNAWSGATGTSFPNPTDGGLYVAPMYLTEGSVIRASLPGMFFIPQVVGSSTFPTGDSLTGVTGLAGKTLRAVANGQGAVLFDTTGPWR